MLCKYCAFRSASRHVSPCIACDGYSKFGVSDTACLYAFRLDENEPKKAYDISIILDTVVTNHNNSVLLRIDNMIYVLKGD